jgi:hypothetical protein
MEKFKSSTVESSGLDATPVETNIVEPTAPETSVFSSPETLETDIFSPFEYLDMGDITPSSTEASIQADQPAAAARGLLPTSTRHIALEKVAADREDSETVRFIRKTRRTSPPHPKKNSAPFYRRGCCGQADFGVEAEKDVKEMYVGPVKFPELESILPAENDPSEQRVIYEAKFPSRHTRVMTYYPPPPKVAP